MSGSKYEVASQTVDQLLSPMQALFEVPRFQRTFSWGTDEVGQLVSDLFSESDEAELPYFLGSIVLARKDETAHNDMHLILDGQQRLITISLILAALIDRLQGQGYEDISEYKSRILSKKSVKEKRRQPKLTLQTKDAKGFADLIQSPMSYKEEQYKHSAIGIALRCIFEQIDGYEDNLPYDEMLERLLHRVELVRIVAPSEQDAFRLFETLNDRGLALSAADLIKNKLFSQCGDTIDEAFDSWTAMLVSLRDEDIVNYLRYYWMAFKEFTRTRELHKTYQRHIGNLSPDDAGFLALELADVAENYAYIARPMTYESPWGVAVAEILERLNIYRARSCRPVLLACSRHLPNEMQRVAEICEAITVRYSIIAEKNTNNLEHVYAKICERIRNNDSGPLSSIFDAQLLLDVPGDEEFIDKLAHMEIKTTVPAWRTILCSISDATGTGETRIREADKVHIEHILPQNPSLKALKEAGFGSRDEAVEYISRIGNLTLLSSQKNLKASNKPFSEKRVMYAESEILMTRDLTLRQQWSADMIDWRSRELASIAANIFRDPVMIAQES